MRKTFVIFSLSLLALTGCSDFLNPSPESNYYVESAYKTQDDFEYAINGVYDAQQSLYSKADTWMRLGIVRSDEVRAGQGGSSCKGVSTCINDANVPMLVNVWQYFWQIITRSNVILARIDAGTFQEESARDYIKGQAYALRAWAYYNLCWQFGGMPIIDEEISLSQVYNVKRSTAAETFEFAENDYKKAIGLLPETWSGTNVGRITKYAAMGGLARLYVFNSEWSKAKYYLKQIIDCGRYSMAENYEDCFNDYYDNSPERLWEVQFIGGNTGEGTEFPTGLLPETYNKASISDGSMLIPFNGLSTAMTIALDFMDAYEQDDKRKAVSTVQYLNVGGVVEQKYSYITKYLHYTYQPTQRTDWACNLPVMRYTDVLMLYAECLNEEMYSPYSEAFTILNDVRARAGLPAKSATELYDQESFREALRSERKIEFAFEGLRWWDLLRWNVVEEVMNEHFATLDNGKNQYQMTEKYRLFPIPFTEISRYNNEDVMWQNPGF